MISFKNLRLKNDFKKIQILFIWIYSLFLLTIVIEFFSGQLSFQSFIWHFIFANISMQLIRQTLKKLYYSFWTLSAFFLIYLVNSFTHYLWTPATSQLLYLYAIMIILFLFLNFLLISPLYYPLIRWWDFKKNSLRVMAKIHLLLENNLEFEARLMDIRRLAGCLLCFKNLEIGSELVLDREIDGLKEEICVKIVSKREYSFGRGYFYGIEFRMNDDFDKRKYQDFKETLRKQYAELKFA